MFLSRFMVNVKIASFKMPRNAAHDVTNHYGCKYKEIFLKVQHM